MKFSLFKNKKGSVQDPITMGAFLVVISITIFVAYYLWSGFGQAMKTASTGMAGEELINATVNSLSASYASIDYMIPILVVGFMIVSLILAFKTGANIIYGFLSIISWGFAVLMSIVYTDIFALFLVSFPDVAVQYPILVFIMSNMKWIVIAWIFLISLVMFTKNRSEDTDLTHGLTQVYG